MSSGRNAPKFTEISLKMSNEDKGKITKTLKELTEFVQNIN